MKIRIDTPYALNKIGRRLRQEDSIMPEVGDSITNEKCFVLCDGMGGHGHGDVAGKLVSTMFYNAVTYAENADKSPELVIANGVKSAYEALDDKARDRDYEKMGTTLAALYLSDCEYYAIHIGDSRIYHFRPSLYIPENPSKSIMYKSWDHSLVNLMVKIGEISEEEAAIHPKRNVLIKAMQPNMGDSQCSADIHHSTDVMAGDYFFLSSDGVTGCINDDSLCSIFANKELSDTEKIAMIDSRCEENSNDNYSCWLIPVI